MIKTLYISLLLVIVVFDFSCRNNATVEPFDIGEIKEIRSWESLSATGYLRLASSNQLIAEIFKSKDTTVALFKEQIIMGAKNPILFINREKDFSKWIEGAELEHLVELTDSKQTSMNIINNYASEAEIYPSTIGKEAIFLINLFKGNNYLNSNHTSTSQYAASRQAQKWWKSYTATKMEQFSYIGDAESCKEQELHRIYFDKNNFVDQLFDVDGDDKELILQDTFKVNGSIWEVKKCGSFKTFFDPEGFKNKEEVLLYYRNSQQEDCYVVGKHVPIGTIVKNNNLLYKYRTETQHYNNFASTILFDPKVGIVQIETPGSSCKVRTLTRINK